MKGLAYAALTVVATTARAVAEPVTPSAFQYVAPIEGDFTSDVPVRVPLSRDVLSVARHAHAPNDCPKPPQSNHCFLSLSFMGTYRSVRYDRSLEIMASTSILKPLEIIFLISRCQGRLLANHG